MAADSFRGKRILVLGGSAREVIDGVRYYANHGRPEMHGLALARRLHEAGAEVTFVTTPPDAPRKEPFALISETPDHGSITSAEDLVQAASCLSATQRYDAVCNMANIAGIRPAQRSEHKLKVKKESGSAIPMEVMGNIAMEPALRSLFPNVCICGYDNWQEWFGDPASPLAQGLHGLACGTQHVPVENALPPPAMFPTPDSASLKGRNIIVSSGPTVECISDSGDVITNLSSGRQGHAVALALAGMGAQVVLVSGAARVPSPLHGNIAVRHVLSAKDMFDAVLASLPADAYVGVAAVADFGMAHPVTLRLGQGERATLSLCQNPDILHSVARHPAHRPAIVIGFAAETDNLLAYARSKLERKGVDAICANRMQAAHGGSRNQVTWITATGNEVWETMDKAEVGIRIGGKIAQWLAEKKPAPQH